MRNRSITRRTVPAGRLFIEGIHSANKLLIINGHARRRSRGPTARVLGPRYQPTNRWPSDFARAGRRCHFLLASNRIKKRTNRRKIWHFPSLLPGVPDHWFRMTSGLNRPTGKTTSLSYRRAISQPFPARRMRPMYLKSPTLADAHTFHRQVNCRAEKPNRAGRCSTTWAAATESDELTRAARRRHLAPQPEPIAVAFNCSGGFA